MIRDKIHLFDNLHFVRMEIGNFLEDKEMEKEAKEAAIAKLKKEFPDSNIDFRLSFPDSI